MELQKTSGSPQLPCPSTQSLPKLEKFVRSAHSRRMVTPILTATLYILFTMHTEFVYFSGQPNDTVGLYNLEC